MAFQGSSASPASPCAESSRARPRLAYSLRLSLRARSRIRSVPKRAHASATSRSSAGRNGGGLVIDSSPARRAQGASRTRSAPTRGALVGDRRPRRGVAPLARPRLLCERRSVPMRRSFLGLARWDASPAPRPDVGLMLWRVAPIRAREPERFPAERVGVRMHGRAGELSRAGAHATVEHTALPGPGAAVARARLGQRRVQLAGNGAPRR